MAGALEGSVGRQDHIAHDALAVVVESAVGAGLELFSSGREQSTLNSR